MVKMFGNKYGYFTPDGHEYVITDFRTPRPWVNVISNGNYGLIISQLGGGFSWLEHANLNRLTRWQQDLLRDNWGKFIYLRDDESGEYWSPTFQPVQKELEQFLCRHGIGYSNFHSVYNGIESDYRLFVPFADHLEIWTLIIKNKSQQSRRLSVFTYLEWCLGAAPDSHREFHKTFLETEFDASLQVLLARKRLWEVPTDRGHWNTSWYRTAFFACSEPVDGFDGDKEAFLGRYGDLTNPLALKAGELTNSQGCWNDSIATLQKQFQLKPGEKKTLYFFLGAEEDSAQIAVLLAKYREHQQVETEFHNQQQQWQQLLNATTIETPDQAMNIMTNTWLKYQAISCRLWARAAYYQQSGAFGFRDQLQDSQIFLSCRPEWTRKQILLHAAHQFKVGKVLHWWHPITELGSDANMSDDLLWLPFVTIQYLKETADWSILAEPMPFYNDPQPLSLYDHCLRAIDLVLSRFSQRGLPLILAGDWNDGLSAVGLAGKGESIWLAHFLYYLLNEFQPILTKQVDSKKAESYRQRAADLKAAVNRFGWGGHWFWRASKDNGELIGSQQNREGKIYLNAQTWAVLADITPDERKQQALQAVAELLETEVGPLLLSPAYTVPDPLIGYLSRYAPGVRENGGVYSHAAVWAIWAQCVWRDPEAAYRLYQKICPIYSGNDPDRYFAEPYVTPSNIDGPASPHFGRGGWSWYTGSAAWLFRVTVDFLLGVRADYDGLIVDPCLPPDWKSVTVNRLFHGSTYRIQMTSTGDKYATVQELWVDGKKISGNRIPIMPDRDEIQVQVNLY